MGNLYDLRRAHFKGNNGKHGKGGQRHGFSGPPLRFRVPLGTEVIEIKKNMLSQKKAIGAEIRTKVADLDEEGSDVLLAKGGAGG